MKSNFIQFKKNWNEFNFEFYDIEKILKLPSKSVMKKILIISVLEFSVLLASVIIIHNKNMERNNFSLTFINYLYYVIITYYYLKFWTNWKKIDLNLNLKKHSEHILKTIKYVSEYISLSIILLNLNVLILLFEYFKNNKNLIIFDLLFGNNLFSNQTSNYFFVILLSIISLIMWCIYKAFSSKLKDKLFKNLKKLK